jgi:hypothetical protein
MKTYRTTALLLFVAIFFGICGVVVLVQNLQAYFGPGVSIDGELRHDSGALAFSVLFPIPFLLIGVFGSMYYLFARAETSHESITIWNILNREVFHSRWEDVTYVSVSKSSLEGSLIHSGAKYARVPAVKYQPGLMGELANRIPFERWNPGHRPSLSGSPFEASFKGTQDAVVVLFSIVWYGFLIFMAASFVQNHGYSGVSDGHLTGTPNDWKMFAVIGAFFAAIPSMFFLGSWRRFLFGYVSCNEEHVCYMDGSDEVDISWSEVIYVSDDSSISSKGSRTGGLTIASATQSAQIPATLAQYNDLVGMASAHASAHARVYM